MIATTNPATGETLATFEEVSEQQIEEIVARAVTAFHRHRRTSFAERAEKLRKVADDLDLHKESYARLMVREMGKTRGSAIAEVEKCAQGCRYYADNAERFLEPVKIDTDASDSHVEFQPLGVVLAVMPWNFPFWQVIRAAAPALMAGNVILLKHASNVPGCALELERIFTRMGFDQGEFQTMLIGSKAVGRLLEDPRIAAATLTGSDAAGASVGERAGRKVKKVVLELGGSDPFIVMPSADLDEAVRVGIKARTINNGQSCIAAKRFVVHRDVAADFSARFVQGMQALNVGDPMDDATDVGPLASEQTLDDVAQQVEQTVRAGASLACGGKRLPGPGYYFQPTVLTNIPDGSPASDDEIFGPVASMFVVDSLEEAIRRANATRYGLGASVWTRDENEQRRFVEEIESGQVFINAMVASHPAVPFGGIKASGHGRELGEFGIREFVNIKTVWKA